MGYKPAIVVVAYRRLYALERLLNSIDRAYYEEDDIELIISIDYHDENHDVINYANEENELNALLLVLAIDAANRADSAAASSASN